MIIRRRPIVLFLCLMLVLGVLGGSYLLTFHLESLQGMVREQFSHVFGPSVQIGEIHASFFPPQVELVDVYLKEEGSPDPFFHASRLRLDLTLFSFLQEHMESEGLLIDKPSLHILRDAEGRWNIPQAWIARNKEESIIGAWLSPFKVNVVDGEILIIDVLDHEYPQSLLLSGVQLQMANQTPSSPLDFSLSGRLVNKQSESPVAVYGSIEDFSQFLAWVKGATGAPLPQFDLQGRGTLAQTEMARIAKLLNQEALLSEIQGDLEVQGSMRFGPGEQGYQIVFSDMTLQTEALTVKGDASIGGLFEPGAPTIYVNWSGSPIHVSTIVGLVPPSLLSPGLVDAIARNAIGGKMEVISATLSGSLREEWGLSLVGDIRVSEGHLDLGPKWGVAARIEGTVKVEPDQIRLLNLQGLYGSIPVTSGSGLIEFRESGPWFSSELQGEVPVESLVTILHQVFAWPSSQPLSSLRGLQGGGPMRIHFAGPLDRPEMIAFQDASYVPESVSLKVPGLTEPLSGVSGNLTFSPTHIAFDQVRALWRNSEVGIHGSMIFQGKDSFDNVQIQGLLQGKDVLEWIGPNHIPNGLTLQGPMQFEGMLSGHFQMPRVALLLTLDRVELGIPKILAKSQGVEGTLNLEVLVDGKGGWSMERIGLSLPALQVSGKGVFPLEVSHPMSASFILEPVTISKLPAGVTILENFLEAGTVEISLNFEGPSMDWQQWKKNGWVAISDGQFRIEGIQAPIGNALVRLKLHDHEMDIKRLEWEMMDSHARIEGIVHHWESRPVVRFSGFGQNFDLDLLIPKGRRSPVRAFLERVAATMQVSGQLNFDGAYYKDMRFSKLAGKLHIQKEVIAVGQIIGKLVAGTVNGRFLVHLPVGAPASMKTWFNLADVPLDVMERSFLTEEVLKERMLTGILSLEGMLEGDGKSPEGIFPTLQGTLNCKIKDGRVQRGTIVPKILALMNLPTLLQGKVDLQKEGYPFDTQSATVEVKDGVFTSKDIVMNGPILKMTAAGTYDGVRDELNLVAAASPFGPYFDLLKKVSLFRLLLEGEDSGKGMALFEVKGPLRNPTTTVLPFESFASGLTGFAKLAFTVLKNTVMLPATILFPNEQDPSDESNQKKIRESQPSPLEVVPQ